MSHFSCAVILPPPTGMVDGNEAVRRALLPYMENCCEEPPREYMQFFEDEEYEADPYSGLSYAIVHGSDDCCGECPVSTSDLLPWLYETREEATAAWNRRVERTCRIVVSHGIHGPEPRFPGDVWTMHHVCSACGGAVDGGDRYCRHCGARVAREGI